MWVEIFKTGAHTDSSGRSSQYPPESLDLIAAKYNSLIHEDPAMAAPVVKGHPQTDSPAYGWVDRLARRGNKLIAFIRDINSEFAAEVRDGMFRKVSIALYPDMLLKHVGFLGAAAPAVKGLAAPEFADGSKEMTYQLDAGDENYKMEVLQLENKKLKEEINLLQKEGRLKQYREFAESLIHNPRGALITPAQTDAVVDMLEMAHRDMSADSSTYSENDNSVKKIMNFFQSLKPSFSLNEFAVRAKTVQPEEEFKGVPLQDSRIELHENARQIQLENPGLCYEEAVLIAQKNI